MKRGFIAALLLVLVVPGVAGAHATLLRATPAEQGRVEVVPTELRLAFDQSVTAPPDEIVVLAADGRRLSAW